MAGGCVIIWLQGCSAIEARFGNVYIGTVTVAEILRLGDCMVSSSDYGGYGGYGENQSECSEASEFWRKSAPKQCFLTCRIQHSLQIELSNQLKLLYAEMKFYLYHYLTVHARPCDLDG